MFKKYSIAVLISVFAAIIAISEALAQPPEIIVGRNGEGEVIFARNNCVVYYNARGNQTKNLPACRGGQLRRADEAMAAYRREQGLDSAPAHHSPSASVHRPPQIIVGRNGEGEVIFAENNCVVYYNARGRRVKNLRSCWGGQMRRADQAMAAYRREQGLDGGSAHHSPSASIHRPPQIIVGRNGDGEVIFAENNCVVYYNFRGQRVKNLRSCWDGQLQRADQAMAAYRREQGYH